MSEEERILFLEQKALAEEEMRKKKEDMLMQFLKVWIFQIELNGLHILLHWFIIHFLISYIALNNRQRL